MSTEREPNAAQPVSDQKTGTPSESSVEDDFTVPADADYTTPGDPIDEESEADSAVDYTTPGTPIENETSSGADYTTPGDPIDDAAHRAEADAAEGGAAATPGNPLER